MGSINGVTINPKIPGSIRSRDRNDKQRLAFSCDPSRPFTGIIHIQASVGDPNTPDQDSIWFDIASMEINNEGGSWSFEPQGEFSSIRVVCRTGNYWSGATGVPAASVSVDGDFTINGISISVSAGDNASTVATTINTNGSIQSDGTIIADIINSTTLRIYKTDGASLILTNTTNTPLTDMGITPGTYTGGVISKIRMLR